MTSARSVVASAVALGFASTLTTPLPALATPATCTTPGHHAAQAGAELLRINRLELGAIAARAPRSETPPSRPAPDPPSPASPAPSPSSPAPSAQAADNQAGFAPAAWAPSGDPEVRADDRTRRAIGGVGLGDARSVLIADGPIKSAAAARVLNGRVAGSAGHNDLLVRQTPPAVRKPSSQPLGAKRFGPLRAGGGKLAVHAGWEEGMGCGAVVGDASTSSASLTRVAVAGGGNQSFLRVPEKITSTTGTALRHRADEPESVATATFQGGKLNLADGEVRIRVLRAATLQVSMARSGRGEVSYEPALVEVTGRDRKISRLDTPGDHIDITLGDEPRAVESVPARLAPIGPLPGPRVPGLPLLGVPEKTGVPAGSPVDARVRISLGEVRQATEGRAIAARATAVQVSLVRPSADSRAKNGYGRSGVVADLGIGLLEGAAVAPEAGTPPGAGLSPTDASDDEEAGAAGLPITGPRIVPLLLTGAGLVIGGVLALLAGTRRRRD